MESCKHFTLEIKALTEVKNEEEFINTINKLKVPDDNLSDNLLYYLNGGINNKYEVERFSETFIYNKNIYNGGVEGFENHECVCERWPYLSIIVKLRKYSKSDYEFLYSIFKKHSSNTHLLK